MMNRYHQQQRLAVKLKLIKTKRFKEEDSLTVEESCHVTVPVSKLGETKKKKKNKIISTKSKPSKSSDAYFKKYFDIQILADTADSGSQQK